MAITLINTNSISTVIQKIAISAIIAYRLICASLIILIRYYFYIKKLPKHKLKFEILACVKQFVQLMVLLYLKQSWQF